mgnify:CR=1 FL=1
MTKGARRASGVSPGQPIKQGDSIMSVPDNQNQLLSQGKKKRRILSAEKKFQIFLESQRGDTPTGEILRREGLFSTDLARVIKEIKEGALARLSVRPGISKKSVASQNYNALKRELEEKERVLAEQAVELAILRKKTNGGSWER